MKICFIRPSIEASFHSMSKRGCRYQSRNYGVAISSLAAEMIGTLRRSKVAYMRLPLMVIAICLLGFTGCSSTGDTGAKDHGGSYLTIGTPTYNTNTGNFESPSPFGAESNQH